MGPQLCYLFQPTNPKIIRYMLFNWLFIIFIEKILFHPIEIVVTNCRTWWGYGEVDADADLTTQSADSGEIGVLGVILTMPLSTNIQLSDWVVFMEGRGRVALKKLGGVYNPVPKMLTLIENNNCTFPICNKVLTLPKTLIPFRHALISFPIAGRC